jgi:ribonuclease-3
MTENKANYSPQDKATIEAIEKAFSYSFNQPERILKALTHASVGNGDASKLYDYERLEFLGDRVLNLIIADLLLKLFPNEKEGDLARRHTAFVRGEALAVAARKIKVQDYLRLSASEKAAGGAENDNILADCMEALLAALYLDAGFARVYQYVEKTLGKEIAEMKAPPVDPKTGLQEWTQARGMGLPLYELEGRSGPDHAPEFFVSVSVQDKKGKEIERASGTGASKRAAEKEAAKALMALLTMPQD